MFDEPIKLLAEIRDEIQGLSSPWKTREQAAAYLGCTPHWVDDMVARGLLVKRYLANSPRFHRNDLDKLITNAKVNVRLMKPVKQEKAA